MAKQRARKKKEGSGRKKEKQGVESLPVIHGNAAGIDLGSEEHYVAVPGGRSETTVRTFKCHTAELHAMGRWLKECGVETVAMESTGVYWIPVMEILEGHYGLEVCLVHPSYTKNVPGRKTDVQDCQWIQTLHSYGLLRASFRPDDAICTLRKHWRHRSRLVRDAAQQVLRMQKELDEMNLHLHKVVSDITGLTGMSILRAILAGERDPQKLAELKHRRAKATKEEIAQALTGNYRAEHLETLSDLMETYDHIQRQMARVDERIERELAQFESKVDPKEKPLPNEKANSSRKWGNEPFFDVRTELYRMTGRDLTVVPGFAPSTLMTLVSECGIDMSAWPTEKHFSSWLGLCPGSKITGGKRLSGKTRKVTSKAATALRLAAFGLQNSNSELGGFFRRLRGRLGPEKTITATAHKLACIYYRAMKYGQIYDDRGAEHYELQYRKQAITYLKKKAQQLGCLVLAPGQITLPELENVLAVTRQTIQAIKDDQNPSSKPPDTPNANPNAITSCGVVS